MKHNFAFSLFHKNHAIWGNIKNTSIKYVCCNGRHISQLIKHPFLLLLPFNNLLSVLISAFYSLIFTKSFFLLVSCYKNVDILSYRAKNAYLGVVYIALNYNAFFLIGYNKKWDFGNIIMGLCEQIMKIRIWIVCSFQLNHSWIIFVINSFNMTYDLAMKDIFQCSNVFLIP